MFCVECGNEGKIFRNGLCINCYIKNSKFTQGPEILDITSCPKCSSYKFKSTWINKSFLDALNRHIKDSFQISKELTKVNIETECDEKGKNVPCKVIITGFLEEQEITEQHFITVRLRETICDICSKQYGGYYEAILQVRAENRKPTKRELRDIKTIVVNSVENFRAKGNRGLFITEIGEEQKGIDFYLSERGSAYTIAKKIQEKYGGEIKQSSKDFGVKDGRQVYRMTYLVRLPGYKEGDFISHDNSYFLISSISSNKVHILDLSSWTEKVIDGNELQKAHIHGGKELVKEVILVSQSQKEVQVMDSKTYQTFEIKKPKPCSIEAKTVPVVQIKDKLFLLNKN